MWSDLSRSRRCGADGGMPVARQLRNGASTGDLGFQVGSEDHHPCGGAARLRSPGFAGLLLPRGSPRTYETRSTQHSLPMHQHRRLWVRLQEGDGNRLGHGQGVAGAVVQLVLSGPHYLCDVQPSGGRGLRVLMGDVLPLASGASTGGYGDGGHKRATSGSERHQHAPPEHQLRARRVCVAAARAGHPPAGTDGKATAYAAPGGIGSGFVESGSDGVANA